MMHTRGLIARPWQQGLTLGASEIGQGLAVVMQAEGDWSGKLVFDIPRHRLYMGFEQDWPRLNTMPEWFTVELERTYRVEDLTKGTQRSYTGKQLHEGLPIELQAGEEQLLRIKPAGAGHGH
jgi:hypothetical protein